MNANLQSILEAIRQLPLDEQRQLVEELAKTPLITEAEKTRQHAVVDRLFGSLKGLDRETIRKIAEDEEFCGY